MVIINFTTFGNQWHLKKMVTVRIRCEYLRWPGTTIGGTGVAGQGNNGGAGNGNRGDNTGAGLRNWLLQMVEMVFNPISLEPCLLRWWWWRWKHL